MTSNECKCDAETIERFLADRLVAKQLQAFEEHLSACQTCQQRLRDRAAEPDWWQGATEFLSSDSFDVRRGEESELATEKVPAGSAPTRVEDSSLSAEHDGLQRVLDLLTPAEDPRYLGRLDCCDIVGAVGFGGMAVVLKGFEATLNRFVAIKIMAPHLASIRAARERFSREARAAASVLHPNVIAIHCVSQFRGLPYLVMPYVAGGSLQQRLDDGPLEVEAAVRIGMQIAAGLAAAHEQGLVHRDIKPANILLEPGLERVVITDFGLARAADDASITQTGILAGTPHYMSPEQARGDRIDQRSDLFSLGSLLFTMTTGDVPFRAETSYGVLRKITDQPAPSASEARPDLPRWLDRLIFGLHRGSPDERYQSAGEVHELLAACLASLQSPDASIPKALLPSARPPRWSLAIAAALVIGLVTAAFLWEGLPFRNARDRTITGMDERREEAETIVWPADGRWVTLTGRFVLEGEVRPRPPIVPSRDVSVYRNEIPDERLLVDADNQGIANMVVWIEQSPGMSIHPDDRAASDRVALRFDGGRLRPHVLLARSTQQLTIGNRDLHRHIVSMAENIRSENESFQVPGGEEVVRKLVAGTDPVHVRCEFHPWMGAVMLVQDHPWMAVSDSDGRFRIDAIPAGNWWLHIWHELQPNIEYTIDERGFGEAWEDGRRKISFDRPVLDLGEIYIEF